MVGVLEVNKLIVESENDKFFIQRVIDHLNLDNIEISEPICNVDEYVCLDGISNLKHKLQDMKLDDIDVLGIVLDADKVGIEQRVQKINEILSELDINVEFDKPNEFKHDTKLDIKVICHVLHVNGNGDLDNVLKSIAKNTSTFSDCLESWRDCLKEKGEDVSDKAFLKFWVSNYLRFDTCSKVEQKQSFRKCNFEQALQKDAWDFGDIVLDELKEFLNIYKREI